MSKVVNAKEAVLEYLLGKKVRRTTWPKGWVYLTNSGIKGDGLNVYSNMEETCYLSPIRALEKNGFNPDKKWEVK